MSEPKKYRVRIQFRSEVECEVEAESEQEAETKAREEIDGSAILGSLYTYDSEAREL